MPKQTKSAKKRREKKEKWKKKQTKYLSNGKKDYSYRGTWAHKLSRARNKAQRGGLTKKEMKKKYGRYPRKNEWWGPEKNEKEWKEKWIKENPPYRGTTTITIDNQKNKNEKRKTIKKNENVSDESV